MNRLQRNLASGIGLLLFATGAAWAEETYELDIADQELSSALKLFAEQSGLQVVYFAAVAEGRQANGVQGTYSAGEALAALLEDTDLAYLTVDDRTYSISGTAQVTDEGGDSDSGNGRTAGAKPVLMTQAQTSVERNQAGQRTETESDKDERERPLEEIVVTGTQIRGTAPVGVDVITLDREYIELSGVATTMEVIQSIPQNFGGGANEDTATANVGGGNNNLGFASSVNLRGLGTESTLLLINGRRSAGGGGDGNFVDLNSIPATAIERVEILPNGASAIYGSDAVGGVINVVLRDDYKGAETRLRYAPGTSDIDEIRFSQVFGNHWGSGNFILTYEYYDRSALKSADREYTRNSDLTSLGGTNHNLPISNPGNIVRYTLADGSSSDVTLAIPSGQDGTSLIPADLLPGVANLRNTREGTTVLPSQRRHSASVLLSQRLSDAIDMFAEARYSSREFQHRTALLATTRLTVPSSNPFFVDPFGGSQSLDILYSFIDDFGPPEARGSVDTISATLGATFGLSNSWTLEAYGAYGIEETASGEATAGGTPGPVNTALLAAALADPDPNTAFNPFGDGSNTNPSTLAAIEGFAADQLESELAVFNIRLDGELFDVPGGATKLAIGAQFRTQSLFRHSIDFIRTPEPVESTLVNFDLERNVRAAFAEIYIPLVTEKNSRSGIEKLEVSLAGRFEDYSDFGGTFNPKVGLSWSPAKNLMLRATAGTSFRAPLLTELDSTNNVSQLFNSTAVGAPPGFENVLYVFGNSPDLEPVEGTTWTAGLDVTPSMFPRLKIGLTYFATTVDNVIALPGGNLLQPLRDQETFAPILTLRSDLDLAAADAILKSPNCFFCDGVQAEELDALVDFRNGNVGKAELSGLDLNLHHFTETGFGLLDISIYASHLFEFKEQVVNGPLEGHVDTISNPTSLTLRGGVAWRNDGINAGLFVNHIGDYTDTFSNPERNVSSWTTWDLRLGYDPSGRHDGLLDGTKVTINILNLFDTDPPFVDASGGFGFDSNNADPKGRFLALQVMKEW